HRVPRQSCDASLRRDRLIPPSLRSPSDGSRADLTHEDERALSSGRWYTHGGIFYDRNLRSDDELNLRNVFFRERRPTGLSTISQLVANVARQRRAMVDTTSDCSCAGCRAAVADQLFAAMNALGLVTRLHGCRSQYANP